MNSALQQQRVHGPGHVGPPASFLMFLPKLHAPPPFDEVRAIQASQSCFHQLPRPRARLMSMAWTLFTISAETHIVLHSHNHVYRSTNEVDYARDAFAGDSPSEYSESGTPAPPPLPPTNILRFTTDHMPKNPSVGFVFGADKNKCDVLLHVNRNTGISGTQFAITFRTDTCATILRNLSRAGTKIEVNRETIHLRTQRAIVASDTLSINLPALSVQLFVGSNDDVKNEYPKFLAKLGSIPPELNQMRLHSSTSTSITENSSSNQYHLVRRIGQGASAIVYQAFHKRSGDLVAVKCFANNSRVGNPWKESSILCLLQHVCWQRRYRSAD